jgi:hypothetical protein
MQELLVESIRIDGGTQSRETIDKQYVADLAEVIKGGTRLPPIEVYGDGTDVWCADGYHRLEAHLAAGKRSIRCNVHKGTREDAIWASCAANKEHGLRRQKGDIEKAIRMAVELKPSLSQTAIALHIGCTHGRVCQVVNVNNLPRPDRVTGKDGKEYPARRIRPPWEVEGGDSPPQGDGEEGDSPPARAKPAGERVPVAGRVDAVDKPIPVHLRGLFDRATEVQALLTQLTNVKSALKRAEASEDVLFGDVNFNSVFAALETAYDGIKATTPYAVCPWCQGQLSDQCRGCGHRGVLGKYRYENTVPRELK